jgi:HAD superfamily hydrolase (TIGR01490 family)
MPQGQNLLGCDVDGTHMRWQLFHHFIKRMVKEGLFPHIVATRIKRELKRFKHRKNDATFADFIAVALDAYQAERRMSGIRVSDVEIAAYEVVEEKGGLVHVFTRELIAAAKDNGFLTAFISGSPTEAVAALAKRYGVDAWIGTEHPHENGFYTGDPPKEWVRDKSEAIRRLQLQHKINLKGSVAIGDSEGDIPMLEMVRFPIAFQPNNLLRAKARERGWPVVYEKKNTYSAERPNRCHKFVEVGLTEILPTKLAHTLEKRLQEARLYT